MFLFSRSAFDVKEERNTVICPPKRPDNVIKTLINALTPLGEEIHIVARRRIG